MVVHPFLSHAHFASQIERIGDPMYHDVRVPGWMYEQADAYQNPITTMELTDRISSRLRFLNGHNVSVNPDLIKAYHVGSAISMLATEVDLQRISEAFPKAEVPSLNDVLPWFHTRVQLDKQKTDDEINKIPGIVEQNLYGQTLEVRATTLMRPFAESFRTMLIAIGRTYKQPNTQLSIEKGRTAAMLGYAETTASMNGALHSYDDAVAVLQDINRKNQQEE